MSILYRSRRSSKKNGNLILDSPTPAAITELLMCSSRPDKPFHNPITGKRVKYYEVDITSFAKQIYPNLSPTPMIGYDGSYPCPAFLEEKGVESIVRFTNHGQLPSAAHLHGSYSVGLFFFFFFFEPSFPMLLFNKVCSGPLHSEHREK